MKSRTLRRLRRALKKRNRPARPPPKRLIQPYWDALIRGTGPLPSSPAEYEALAHPPTPVPPPFQPKPTGGALLAAMLTGKKA